MCPILPTLSNLIPNSFLHESSPMFMCRCLHSDAMQYNAVFLFIGRTPGRAEQTNICVYIHSKQLRLRHIQWVARKHWSIRDICKRIISGLCMPLAAFYGRRGCKYLICQNCCICENKNLILPEGWSMLLCRVRETKQCSTNMLFLRRY